jgi:hypothetical protein
MDGSIQGWTEKWFDLFDSALKYFLIHWAGKGGYIWNNYIWSIQKLLSK